MPACSVLNCKSRSELGIRLFGLPQGERNEDRRNAWITNINRKCLPTNVFVCEKHFQQDQFENNRRDGRRPLKYNAVPTLFDFKPEKRLTRGYKASTKKRKSKQYSSDDTDEEEFTFDYTKCRACLAVIKTTEGHVLTKKLTGGTLREKICTFIPELSTSLLNDQHICEECFESLVQFIRFRDTCLDSDEKLRNGETLTVKVDRNGSPVELETETYKKGKGWEAVERRYKTRSVNKKKQVLNECKTVNVENHENSNDVEKDSQPEPIRKRGRPRKKEIVKDVINTNDSSNDVEPIISDNEDKMSVEQKENSLKTDSDTVDNQLEDKDDKTKIFSEHDYSYESFSCPECRMDYRTIKGIKNHLVNFHKILDDPEYACAECPIKLQRFQDMLDHRSTHGYACTFCDKSFPSPDELAEHEPDHPEKFHCANCGRAFEKEGDLTKHAALHEVLSKIKLMMAKRRDSQQHECTACGDLFPSKPKLKEHVKMAHSKLKEVDYPGKFTGDSSLNLHRRARNSDHKTYQNVKKKSIQLISIVRSNITASIIAENDYECSFCSQTFPAKESLVAHLPLHEHERKFECNYCGIKLNDKRAKTAHEDSHKSDVGHQFLCMTCFKRFPNEADRRAHEAAHSNASEQFNCCLCDLRFARKLPLDNHLLDDHADARADGNEKNVKVFKIKWQNRGELDGDADEFVIEDVCQSEQTRPRYDEAGADKTIVVILDDEKITQEKS
ncbi:unnamed protein product [Phyllotreta striolata]|uniref:Uncharacterized protein n=1 Tax=Phyllotreta striolata TaxID=444603 RepID=A0A9N9TWA7_PHYSR|nr:unnamed protein product [Phyllotreta striolata]